MSNKDQLEALIKEKELILELLGLYADLNSARRGEQYGPAIGGPLPDKALKPNPLGGLITGDPWAQWAREGGLNDRPSIPTVMLKVPTSDISHELTKVRELLNPLSSEAPASKPSSSAKAEVIPFPGVVDKDDAGRDG